MLTTSGRRRAAPGVAILSVAILGVAVLGAGSAAAWPLKVAVIQPTGDDPVLAEAARRLGAELAAAGMRAAVVACAPGFDPRCPAPVEAGDVPDAVVAILRLVGTTAIEVKVTTDHARHVLARRMDIGIDRGGDDPSVLAIRAVELLRATLMRQTTEGRPARELAGAQDETALVAAIATAAPVAAQAGEGTSWSLSAGAALLQSLDKLGSAFGPEARVALRPYRSFGFEVRLAALAFAPALTAPAGTASLQQYLGDVGASYAIPLGRRLISTVSAGLGAYYITVTGHAANPAQDLTNTLWAAQLQAGLGLTVILRPEYALRLDAAAVFVEPSPYVTIGTAEEFHAGRPLLLISLALERGLPDVWGSSFR